MSARTLLAAVLALASSASAESGLSLLTARVDLEPGTFHGLALSLGTGRSVCGRATFNRRAAAAGGRVLVLDAAGPGDEEAIRMSQAVIVRRGGLSSRAGVAARRHGVPAVALGQGRWDASGTVLHLDAPTYGKQKSAAGFTYQPVVGSEERVLREGDAVAIDAATGRVTLIAPEEAEDRIAAAEAALAYDGLRDALAIEHWLASSLSPRRASALLEELVVRAVAGAMPPTDLARVRRAAEAAVPAAAREEMRRVEARAFTRAIRQTRRYAEDCASDVADAADAASLERLGAQARAAAGGAAAVSGILSLSDNGAAAEARACGEAAARRARARAGKHAPLSAAVAAAGADRPEGEDIPPDSWRRFVLDNDLGEWLARTVDDASLGLRLKSERIRLRILSGKIDASSAAGRAARSAASGPALIVGPDAAIKAEGPSDALERLKEVWAASWSPGPLGTRLRAGRPLDYEGRVRVEKIVPADVSGVVFSRDPGSGRRERILIEALSGSLDRMLAADAEIESFTLDRRTGRESAPRAGAGTTSLSPERLARVARLARALDAWKGAGVEVSFSFAGPRLLVWSLR
jgi:phosphohistidine swiveling domain-containing protein